MNVMQSLCQGLSSTSKDYVQSYVEIIIMVVAKIETLVVKVPTEVIFSSCIAELSIIPRHSIDRIHAYY